MLVHWRFTLVLKKIKEEKVGKIQEMIKCHVVCVFGMIKILIANLKRHTSSFRGGKIEAETVNHEMLVKFPLTNVFILFNYKKKYWYSIDMSNYFTANLYDNMLSEPTPKLMRAVGFILIRFSFLLAGLHTHYSM